MARPDDFSAEGIVAQLEALRRALDLAPDSVLESGLAFLKRVGARLKDQPVLFTDRVLDSLAALALNSPHTDIHSGNYRHSQTVGQDICLVSVRTLASLCRATKENSANALAALDRIVTESLDWDVRNEALGKLCWILPVRNGAPDSRVLAILVRQSTRNSDAYIRIQSRDGLANIARNHPECAALAVEMQHCGVSDSAPEARIRALAMLTNRALSATCSTEEALTLKALFEKVAAKQTEPPAVIDQARHGLTLTEQSIADRRNGKQPTFTFP